MTAVPPSVTASVMPAGWQTAFTAAMILPTVALVVVAARYQRRHRDAVPLLCLLGGAFACLVEPLVDVLGFCWYPRHGQWALMTVMGRETPILVLPGYLWFMGGFAAVTYVVLRLGADARDVRRLYAAFIAINAVVELPGVHTHVYLYYGHQPMRIVGWPAWWGFVNAAVGILSGCIIHALRARNLGRAPTAVAVVVLVPMVDAGINAGAGWPLFSALASPGWSAVVDQVAGVVTCLLAIIAVVLASALVTTTSPASPT